MQVMKDYHLDLLAIPEAEIPNSNRLTLDNGYTLGLAPAPKNAPATKASPYLLAHD